MTTQSIAICGVGTKEDLSGGAIIMDLGLGVGLGPGLGLGIVMGINMGFGWGGGRSHYFLE